MHAKISDSVNSTGKQSIGSIGIYINLLEKIQLSINMRFQIQIFKLKYSNGHRLRALSQLTSCRPQSGHIGFLFLKSCAMLWNLRTNNFANFSLWDMINFVLRILIKLTEKNIKDRQRKCCLKRCAMFWNACKINFQIFAIFNFLRHGPFYTQNH